MSKLKDKKVGDMLYTLHNGIMEIIQKGDDLQVRDYYWNVYMVTIEGVLIENYAADWKPPFCFASESDCKEYFEKRKVIEKVVYRSKKLKKIKKIKLADKVAMELNNLKGRKLTSEELSLKIGFSSSMTWRMLNSKIPITLKFIDALECAGLIDLGIKE